MAVAYLICGIAQTEKGNKMALIERERLISVMDSAAGLCDLMKRYSRAETIRMVKDLVQTAPTVEAEPVKHGRWIFGDTMGHSWQKCSECCVSQSGQTATFSYCPNCGAKMDGGTE